MKICTWRLLGVPITMHYVRTLCDKYFLSHDGFSLCLTGRFSATQAIWMHFSQSKLTKCKIFEIELDIEIDIEFDLSWRHAAVLIIKKTVYRWALGFYCGRVWWSWKNWFEHFVEGVVVLKELTFLQFLLLEGVVVLKELIFLQFLLWRVWWSWKNPFLTVSTLKGVVVLKVLIFNSFYCGRGWWSWKKWFFTVPTFWGCGGPERTGFNSFYFGRVFLKELIF